MFDANKMYESVDQFEKFLVLAFISSAFFYPIFLLNFYFGGDSGKLPIGFFPILLYAGLVVYVVYKVESKW